MNPWNYNAPGWGQIPPGYSQPQPAHGGYWQQPVWTEPKEGFFHTDLFTSKTRRYPSLHPILAADTTLARVDVRFQPSSEAAIPNATYYAYRHAHATVTQTSHVRLISKDFPWSIDIKTNGHPVTCDDIWNALHAALQQPLADSEWGALSHDPSRAKKVQKAAKQRQFEVDKDKGLKRVDWVAENFILRGLEKDDDFAKRRLAYVDSDCEETWVVKMVTQ
ncbi:hypothetical protein BDM02DRAFT_3107236 [Thelephora ganbajun]|uniref:Uncharacterized protein n=1 Tax=Thelephora ganbajun TaxID=370292 RepID=A0ACB6ZWP5_THEGA|nr:hypothetical protein BDM02DRAFT_3107236 [Thelephora ganbajun]